MTDAFQLRSIRSYGTEVCDPDHMKIFASPAAGLLVSEAARVPVGVRF